MSDQRTAQLSIDDTTRSFSELSKSRLFVDILHRDPIEVKRAILSTYKSKCDEDRGSVSWEDLVTAYNDHIRTQHASIRSEKERLQSLIDEKLTGCPGNPRATTVGSDSLFDHPKEIRLVPVVEVDLDEEDVYKAMKLAVDGSLEEGSSQDTHKFGKAISKLVEDEQRSLYVYRPASEGHRIEGAPYKQPFPEGVEYDLRIPDVGSGVALLEKSKDRSLEGSGSPAVSAHDNLATDAPVPTDATTASSCLFL